MTPQAWFIGDDLGTNGGYALAYGTNSCPEDLPRTWQYWGFHTDQWVRFQSGSLSLLIRSYFVSKLGNMNFGCIIQLQSYVQVGLCQG